MAYDPGAIDATLAAAVGDDPALIAELHQAFAESAGRALQAIERADGAAEWQAAAWRLKGLAASFGATRLMTLAADGVAVAPGDAVYLRKLRRAVGRL